MKFSIDFVYLLVLVFGTLGLMLLLHNIQRSVLTELEEVLYRQKDPDKYLKMLESKRLGLVLRKSTLLLLELNGRLLAGDDLGIQKVYDKAAVTRMNKSESLDLDLKLFNYFIKTGNQEQSRILYKKLEKLLTGEKDIKLSSVLEDAKLLLGVYIDKDTALIPKLLELKKQQSGSRSGITDYRLAKLYWFSGNKQKALESLKLAKSNLSGTDWEPIILQAIENPDNLEKW